MFWNDDTADLSPKVFFSRKCVVIPVVLIVCFVWFDTLHPNQQFFSYVKIGLPVFNQYQARINVSCSRTQCRWGSNGNPMVYPWATALSCINCKWCLLGSRTASLPVVLHLWLSSQPCTHTLFLSKPTLKRKKIFIVVVLQLLHAAGYNKVHHIVTSSLNMVIS